MLNRFKAALLVFAGVIIIAGSALDSRGDDSLDLAVAQYRDKDFGSAYALAGKSTDQAQRAFVRGMAALRLDKFEEALVLLDEAERKLPLIADYAAFYQAEALLNLRKYPAAYAKAASIPALFPASALLRRSEKLRADILFQAGDYKGALKLYQSYIEKYSSGSDALDASYQSARCREESADPGGALLIYRSIWLTSPVSTLATKSEERLKLLEQSGHKPAPYSAEELLKRAATLYAQGHYSASLQTLAMIQVISQPQIIAERINLRAGMAQYRLRRYAEAEKQFAKAAGSSFAGIRSEARFWLAKSLGQQDLKERAQLLYLELAGEGKKQEYADDALIEAAGLKRGLGQYAEAAQMYGQASKLSTDAKTVARSLWDAGWCRYLAGENQLAADQFKKLLAEESAREKVLYWLGRTAEKSGDSTAAVSYYRTLLGEFPAGFYAAWYRERKGIKDARESLGNRDPQTEIPIAAGFEKPRLLASLGLLEEARIEMAALRKKSGEKRGQLSVLGRIFFEMRDYRSSISLFMQNRPVAWAKETLPLWMLGYPRAYTELISRNAALNGLSQGLVYALIRAESGFAPAIKSSAGAIGLMQMMPATAKMTAHEKGDFNPQRLTVPEYNVRLGTKHLHDLMKEYNGDVVYMAAAYNAGSGALKRWQKSFKGLEKDEFIESIPYRETRDYVKKVYASAATYRQLYGIK